MQERINEGYTVTDSIRIQYDEFVIGHHPTAPSPYVVWRVSNGNSYYWGHYFNDRWAALEDLAERVIDAVRLHRTLTGKEGEDDA